MTYADRKRALGIPPNAIDTGFPVDFGSSKYAEAEYLPGKVRDRRRVRPATGADLSHLNDPDWKRLQRIGRAGGRKRAKK